jgi:hypothetical protein
LVCIQENYTRKVKNLLGSVFNRLELVEWKFF